MNIKPFQKSRKTDADLFGPVETLTIRFMLGREAELLGLQDLEALNFIEHRMNQPLDEIFNCKTERGRAQRKFLDALRSKSTRVQMRFARQATEISKECPDACMLLAESSSGLDSKIRWYRAAQNGSRWILDLPFLRDQKGRMNETYASPWIFFQSSFRLAQGLLLAGEYEEVSAIYNELLELDNDDTLKVQQQKPLLYILSKRYADGIKHLQSIADNQNILYKYCKAILTYLHEGDNFNSIVAANEAFCFDNRIMEIIDTVSFPNELFVEIFVDGNGIVEFIENSTEFMIYCFLKFLPVWKTTDAKQWLKLRYEKWQKSTKFIESMGKPTFKSAEECGLGISNLQLVKAESSKPRFSLVPPGDVKDTSVAISMPTQGEMTFTN